MDLDRESAVPVCHRQRGLLGHHGGVIADSESHRHPVLTWRSWLPETLPWPHLRVVWGATGYMSSSLTTSRLRNVGGASQSLANCAANSAVSGRFEFSIAAS